jgi:hypothetical protein
MVIDPATGKRRTNAEAMAGGPYTFGWNTSGVGPGTRGYRGSYRDGGYHYGEGTRRPRARNSTEYYAQRDAEEGNPLDNLFMNGPGGRALMERIANESKVGGQSSNWETMKPAEGEDPFAFIKRRDAAQASSNADQLPTLPPGVAQQGAGDTLLEDGTGIYNMGGGKKQLFGKYGSGSSYTNPFAASPSTTMVEDQVAEIGPLPSMPKASSSPFYRGPDRRSPFTKAADRLAPWVSPAIEAAGTAKAMGQAANMVMPWNLRNTMKGLFKWGSKPS